MHAQKNVEKIEKKILFHVLKKEGNRDLLHIQILMYHYYLQFIRLTTSLAAILL